MGLVDNGDIIVVIGTVIVVGQITQNVYDLSVTTGGGSLSFSGAGAAVQGYMHDLYAIVRQDIVQGAVFDTISVKNRTQGTDVGTYAWDTSGWSGGSANEALPPGVAALVTMPTQVGRTRGRKFLPGYTEGSNTGTATWGAGTLGRLGAFGAYLASPHTIGVGGPTLRYVVVTEGVGAFTTHQPSGVLARDIPAYQRRRKQGVGR